MKIVGVIPARYGSTRFEGKVLANIAGKPMIQHVWERAKTSQMLNDCFIACDDQRVKETCEGFGARAVLTAKDHPSGTDRIAEAVDGLDVDIVVNIQGDEPLIEASLIDDLAKALCDDKDASVSTAIKVIEDQEELNDPNVVKAVIDVKGNALYFSRSCIPFNREKKDVSYYKHLGIYAYRKEFLLIYAQLPMSALEQVEKLEQLRILEAGYKIKTVVTDIETVGVDTKDDLAKVEAFLNK